MKKICTCTSLQSYCIPSCCSCHVSYTVLGEVCALFKRHCMHEGSGVIFQSSQRNSLFSVSIIREFQITIMVTNTKGSSTIYKSLSFQLSKVQAVMYSASQHYEDCTLYLVILFHKLRTFSYGIREISGPVVVGTGEFPSAHLLVWERQSQEGVPAGRHHAGRGQLVF